MKNKFIMILKLFIILTIVSITLGREILISDNIHKGKAMEIKSTSIGDSGMEEVSTSLDGAGTEESPYLIKSAADMRYMRNVINTGIKNGSPGVINGTEGEPNAIRAYYKLVNSIDLGKNWEAICPWKDYKELKGNDTFSGYLDGNHKKIKFSSNEEGLFGVIGEKATIKDLTVDATIANDISERNDISVFHIGIIAGSIYSIECKILGCRIEGSIQINGDRYSEISSQWGFNVGGVVGLNNGIIKDTECSVSINCSNISTYVGGIGGIIGKNYISGQLINCNYELKEGENMILQNVYCDSGGVIGYNAGKVSNIVCTANVEMYNDGSGYPRFGGGIGSNSYIGEVYNTVLDVQIKGKSINISGGYIGGIIAENYGKLYNSYVKGEISSEMKCNGDSKEWVYLGGLVGHNKYNNYYGSSKEIDNCFSMLKLKIIDNSNSRHVNTGGITGHSDTNAKVVNCFGFNCKADGNASSLYGENIKEDGKTFNASYDLPLDEKQKNWLKERLTERTNELNNELKENKYNYWKLDNSIYEGYPFLFEAPYYVKTDDTISVYGNGYPIIVDKNESGNTVIYFDKDGDNEIGPEDSLVKTLVKTLDENGLENKGKEARFGSDCSINIYGGIHNSDINHNSKIIVKGGNINSIYGGGKLDKSDISAKVLLGTVIDIKGGTIGYIDANGKADNEANSDKVVTGGDKTINISGDPVIGTDTIGGINLDSFTDGKLNISSKLTGDPGSTGSIRLIKKIMDNPPDGWDVIATATAPRFTENYNVFKVGNLPNNKTIFNKGNDIIIVDTFKASLKSSDGTVGISGFGDNAAKKGFEWTGKISAKSGYILLDKLTVKMDGT